MLTVFMNSGRRSAADGGAGTKPGGAGTMTRGLSIVSVSGITGAAVGRAWRTDAGPLGRAADAAGNEHTTNAAVDATTNQPAFLTSGVPMPLRAEDVEYSG